MKGLEDYIIPLLGQKTGEQKFEYKIDKAFIEAFDESEILDSEVNADVFLIRNNQTFEFGFKLKGKMHIPCGRCLEPMKLKVKHKAKLVVKLGDRYEEINDELLMVREEDGDFDLAPILYEFLKLSIPIRNVHKEGECDPNMMNILNQYSSEADTSDPRWDDLKKLLNNN